MNILICIGEWINFIYHSKFLISSYMKLDLVVLDVIVDTLYGLINNPSLSFTLPLFDSFFYSISLYSSYIFLECYYPHINHPILYIHLIHWLTSFELNMLNLPYCFESDIICLLIFLGYLSHSLFGY